ncbi:MAG: C25 family cysteine peptidase [Pyrinomonadaceae bacterium]
MNRTFSFLLIATLVLSACFPVFSQRSRMGTQKGIPPLIDPDQSSVVNRKKIRTVFGEISAFSEGAGVLIRWEMASENNNAGFHVYRMSKGSRRVNESMIPGSAARAGDRPLYGGNYDFFDPSGRPGSSYMIESRTMDGGRTGSHVVVARPIDDLGEVSEKSAQELHMAAVSTNGIVPRSDVVLTDELRLAQAINAHSADLSAHRWVVSQPGVKIGIRKQGFYRVSRQELGAAGFPVDSDSANWQLSLEGVEQSIIVGGNGQYIEFLGSAIDTPESDTRIYYLISGTTPGKRIGTRFLRRVSGDAPAISYPVVAGKVLRTSYNPDILNGAAENYWGPIITGVETTLIDFELTGIDRARPSAEITLTLQGYSEALHAVRPLLNGIEIPRVFGSGKTRFSVTSTISTNSLLEGRNTLELISATPNDFSYFDYVQVSYARKYQAAQNKIFFFTPGYRTVTVDGFTSPNVRLFDTTAAGDPVLISNVPAVQNGSGYTLRISSARPMVAQAVEDTALAQAAYVVPNMPSTLTSNPNDSELIIISHSSSDVLAAAESWAGYRRSQGTTVRVIEVADVFDEFSYGISSSAAIRNYLSYAYQNSTVPLKYALLVGDASFDPKNYLGYGYLDHIPAQSVDLVYGTSSSDEALADFDGDGLSEIAIGRIPARTGTAVNTALEKTRTFEALVPQSLSRGALFAFDLPTGWDFEAMSKSIRAEMPETVPASFVGKASSSSTPTLISEINSGKFVVNYSGHGSSGTWSSSFFALGGVPSLTNLDKPSIFTMLTCLNGQFFQPHVDSLAEALLKSPTGGAAVTWASTTETTPDVQEVMARRFYNQLAKGNMTRIGDLIRDAKGTIPGGRDVRLSWALLGDPMLRVR